MVSLIIRHIVQLHGWSACALVEYISGEVRLSNFGLGNFLPGLTGSFTLADKAREQEQQMTFGRLNLEYLNMMICCSCSFEMTLKSFIFLKQRAQRDSLATEWLLGVCGILVLAEYLENNYQY